VAGNWKTNLTRSEAESDVDAFLAEIGEVDDLAFTFRRLSFVAEMR
jgi:hypothetical protein